jgi:hypothetical protein
MDSIGATTAAATATAALKKKQNVEDMSLLSIADGENARGIPIVKFIDDVEGFANSFSPPASAELLIGAYSELHSKFKTFETSLNQKSTYNWVCSYRV